MTPGRLFLRGPLISPRNVLPYVLTLGILLLGTPLPHCELPKPVHLHPQPCSQPKAMSTIKCVMDEAILDVWPVVLLAESSLMRTASAITDLKQEPTS